MSAKPTLTESDFIRAAGLLGVDVAAIKAVTDVESRGRGFQHDGLPVILFERHVFDRLTAGKYRAEVPDLSNPVPGGYGPSSTQHARLARAARLDREAALKSASWGLFQIMGFNFSLAGFLNLQDFINAMYRSEGSQLDAAVGFIANSSPTMRRALQNKDWAAFARMYNGPAYKKNAYDTKLAAAYAKHKGAGK